MNRRILLPLHLTKDQGKLVYKKENQAKLEAEPIEITLGDVTLPLEHLDVNRDIPSRWQSIKSIVNLSKTQDDWENVLRIMEGFQNASAPMKTQWKQFIVRRMSIAGQHHLILKAVQKASDTGLRLSDVALANTVFQTIHWKALESEWNPKETKKALDLAEELVELLEDDRHLGKKDVSIGDIRASPYTIAIPLEMAAVRAKRHTDVQDTDGKVSLYASRFMQATQQDEFLTKTLPDHLARISAPIEAKPKLIHTAQSVINLKGGIQSMIPVWIAVKTARHVLRKDMPLDSDAQKMEEEMAAALKAGEQSLNDALKISGITDMEGVIPKHMRLAEVA